MRDLASNAKKILVIMLSVFLVNITILTLLPSVYADNWYMFHNDKRHTGYSTSTAPITNNIIWTYPTGDDVYSSPAVVDGKVYIGSDDGHLYCLDAEDGDELWNSSIIGTVGSSSPAVVDGRVYIGGNSLFCFNAENGSLVWNYPSSHISSSPVIVDDRVYVGSWDYCVYCLDADPDDNGDGVINHDPYDEIEDDDDEGFDDPFTLEYDLIWKYVTGNLVLSSPAVYNGMIYIGSQDKKIYCLPQDDPNGDGVINNTELIWQFTTQGMVKSSPAIAYGKVYIGSDDHKIYCLYANNGTEKWRYTSHDNVWSSPAVADEKVYIGLGFPVGKIYCLDATTGSPVWDDPFVTGGGITSSSAVADGKVYIGSLDKKLYCLDASDGTKIWEYQTGDSIDYSSPAIANGKLYVGSSDNTIYCFGDEGNRPPNQPTAPSGIKSGSKGIQYSYSTSTTDLDGDQVYYMWNWGNEISDWIGPYPSGETIETRHTWTEQGNYKIKVKSKDIYNAESSWSSSLTVTISDQPFEKELVINVASTVVEDSQFTVTIEREDTNEPVMSVDVTFNEETKQTDENGQVTFTAPSVEEDTYYTIIANMGGYQSVLVTIEVLDRNEYALKGYIYGEVSDSELLPLENVRIRAISGEKSWTTYTDEEGRYVVSAPVDTYTVEASKEGYKTSFRQNIEVEVNTATGVNFILQESEDYEEASVDEYEQLLEEKIAAEIKNNKVGGKIEVTDTFNNIEIYNDIIDINIEPTTKNEEIVSFRVEAPEGTSGQIFVIRIMKDFSGEISVKLDGNQIQRTNNLNTFFNPNNLNTEFVQVSTENARWILIIVPGFSEHTVTISSVISGLVGFIAVISYIIISAIVFIVFLTPMLTNIIRRRMRFR